MSTEAKSKFAVAQHSMERSMMNVKKLDKISNVKLRRSTKIKDVVSSAKQLKWNWAGHIARHNNDRLPKTLEAWNPNTRRKPGRPKSRWKDEIVEHGSILWRRKAQDETNGLKWEPPLSFND
jgi:hypothetical protein